jgi:integrase
MQNALLEETTVHNKPSELETKRMILRVHLAPAFGNTALDEISMVKLEEYKASKLRDGLSPKTINNHLTVLRKLLATAQEWGKLATLPRVRWLKVAEPEFRFLGFDEADRLAASAAPEWRAMVVVALRTGLRLGELLALRWIDVDLKGGRIIVRQSRTRETTTSPKSGRKREVPLSDEAAEALRGHRHLRGDLVFCRETGEHFTKGETKWPLWGACKRAGLERMGWHVLRHTFASHLAMRGATLRAIQELLGHAKIEMTLRYAHLAPEALREAVRLLDRGTPTALRPRDGVTRKETEVKSR